jgi:hypothetical protein
MGALKAVSPPGDSETNFDNAYARRQVRNGPVDDTPTEEAAYSPDSGIGLSPAFESQGSSTDSGHVSTVHTGSNAPVSLPLTVSDTVTENPPAITTAEDLLGAETSPASVPPLISPSERAALRAPELPTSSASTDGESAIEGGSSNQA